MPTEAPSTIGAAAPQAVLFDFDGVLADTENVHTAAWERTFGAIGWDVAAAVCARAGEQDDRAFLEDVFASKGISGGDVPGWVARKQALTRSLLADGGHLYAGVATLVRALRDRGALLAVVSGTWRENVELVLEASGLIASFKHIIAKEDVAATKPDPAGYLLALSRLQVSPASAVAVEDSPTGLAAARAAGLRVVAVGHRRPPGSWTGEAHYIDHLVDTDAAMHILGFPRADTAARTPA